jgi:hypothetical protein
VRQRPDARELERLADEILQGAPLPDDPKGRTYEQRMALKARSIAGYDRDHGAADMGLELSLFAELYGASEAERAAHDDMERLSSLNRQLAAEIRKGEWDREPGRLAPLLMEQVRARLARCNPKYLKAKLGK